MNSNEVYVMSPTKKNAKQKYLINRQTEISHLFTESLFPHSTTDLHHGLTKFSFLERMR